jgi:YgiT-type zinc finger domain-containing protein
MRCDLCKGRVKKSLIGYTLFYEGHWIIVDNVPAKVCQQCGEKLFSPRTVERLQKIIWDKRPPRRKIQTPLYAYH